jgi:hypothetical protein
MSLGSTRCRIARIPVPAFGLIHHIDVPIFVVLCALLNSWIDNVSAGHLSSVASARRHGHLG